MSNLQTTTQVRKRRLQFGLRALLYFVLFVAGASATVLFWGKWSLERVLTGHTGSVHSATFSDDGNLIASVSKETIVWDVRSGKALRTIPQGGRHVAISPDTKLIAIADDSRQPIAPSTTIMPGSATVFIYTISTGQENVKLPPFNAWVCQPAFSPDGKRIATAAEDGKIGVWDVASGNLIAQFDTPKAAFTGIYPEGPRTVQFSTDGKSLGIAYLLKLDISTWRVPWAVAAWNIDGGAPLATGDPMRDGLNPDSFNPNQWYDGPRVTHLPTDAINDLEDVEFHGLWCVRTCALCGSTYAFTTHPDGLIRIWRSRYPIGAFGHLLRPEVWFAIIFGTLWLRSVVAWRRKRKLDG